MEEETPHTLPRPTVMQRIGHCCMNPMCGIGEDEQEAAAWQQRLHPELAQETTATVTTKNTKQKRTVPKVDQLPMRQVGQHGPSAGEGKTYPAAPAMSTSGTNAEQMKMQAQPSSTAIQADQPTALPSQTGSAALAEDVGVEEPPSGTGSRNIAAQGVSDDLGKTETGPQAPSASRDISHPDDGVKELGIGDLNPSVSSVNAPQRTDKAVAAGTAAAVGVGAAEGMHRKDASARAEPQEQISATNDRYRSNKHTGIGSDYVDTARPTYNETNDKWDTAPHRQSLGADYVATRPGVSGNTNMASPKERDAAFVDSDQQVLAKRLEGQGDATRNSSTDYGSAGDYDKDLSYKKEFGTGAGILSATAGAAGIASYERDRREKDTSASSTITPGVSANDVAKPEPKGAMEDDNANAPSTLSEKIPITQALTEDKPSDMKPSDSGALSNDTAPGDTRDAPQAVANDQISGGTASQQQMQAAAMPRAIDDTLQDISKDEQQVKQDNSISLDKGTPDNTSEQVDRSAQGSTGLLDKVKTALGVGGVAAVGTAVAGAALAGHKKEDNETMAPDKTADYDLPVTDSKPGDSGSGTEYAKDTGRANPKATVSVTSQDKGTSVRPTTRDEMDELGITEPIEKQPGPNVGYRTFNNGLDYGDTNNDSLKPKGEVSEQEDPLICTQHIEANAPRGGSMNYGSTGDNLTDVTHKQELGAGVGILAATAGVAGAAAYEGNRSKIKELERTKYASSSDQLSPSVTSDSELITSGQRGAMQSDSMEYSSAGLENTPKRQSLDEYEITTGPALGEEQREPGTLDSSTDATVLPHTKIDLSPGMLTHINMDQGADEDRSFQRSFDSQTQSQMPSSKDNAANSFGTTRESESLNADDQQSVDHRARNAALLAGGAAGGATLAAIPVAFGKTKSEGAAYTGDTGKFAEAQAVEPMDSSEKIATTTGGFPENVENKSNTLSQAQIPSRLQSTTAEAAKLSNAEEYEALPSDTLLNPNLELPFDKDNTKQGTEDAPMAGDFSIPSQGYAEKGDLRDLATRRPVGTLITTEEPDTNRRSEEPGLKEAPTVSGPQNKAIHDATAESQGSMVEERPVGAQKTSGAAVGAVGAGAATDMATLGLYGLSRRSSSPVKGAGATDTSTQEASNAPSKTIHDGPQAGLSPDDEASYPESAYMTPSTHYEGDDGSIEQLDDDSFRNISSALNQMNISRPLGIQAESMPGGYTSSLAGYPETPEAVIKQNVRKRSTTVEETPDTEDEPVNGDDDDEYEPINFARSDSIIGVPEPLKGSKPNSHGVVTDEPTPKAPRSPQLQAADKLNFYPSPSPRMSPSPLLRNKTPVEGLSVEHAEDVPTDQNEDGTLLEGFMKLVGID